MGSGSGGSAISIHAPHTGRDNQPHSTTKSSNQFQSTRPIRGATYKKGDYKKEARFQSTRPIRGATGYQYEDLRLIVISIHAPHTGRDRLLSRG